MLKRNPWPIAIIAFFVVFISFLTSFIVFAARQKVDLVRPDYYEEEIRFQKQLDKVERTRESSDAATLTYDATQRSVEVKFPPADASTLKGNIRLYRPSNATLDRVLPVAVKPDGRQSIDVNTLEPGLWKVKLDWAVGEKEYYIDQTLVIRSRSNR